MSHLRTLALVAAPTALLVGLAVPVSADDAPRPKKPRPSSLSVSSCQPGPDQVVTAAESLKLVNECGAQRTAVKQWRWMGNYGSVYDVTTVANRLGLVNGELLVTPMASGLLPTFMYY
ncbi:hypothetical protein [Streptomyces tsukubensis]|uniref:hypothetical protein n=1 Tax=Streptomyces tsukubensis TaxID=83656 RepID=UPI00344D308C